jgi:hypothetical protein
MPAPPPSATTLPKEEGGANVDRMTELLFNRLMKMGMPPQGAPFIEAIALAISAWVRNDLVFKDPEQGPTEEDKWADLTQTNIWARPKDMANGNDGKDLGTTLPIPK